nr:unnamed protein product [Callosobruchus chinensis]
MVPSAADKEPHTADHTKRSLGPKYRDSNKVGDIFNKKSRQASHGKQFGIARVPIARSLRYYSLTINAVLYFLPYTRFRLSNRVFTCRSCELWISFVLIVKVKYCRIGLIQGWYPIVDLLGYARRRKSCTGRDLPITVSACDMNTFLPIVPLVEMKIFEIPKND